MIVSVAANPNDDSNTDDSRSDIRQPPTEWLGKLVYLGPGIIIAGSIVGAGELVATTATGAVAGFSLLWLIILGCVIKVFVQVELGKHAVLTGKGTMEALGDMPGPRIGKVNWALTAWFIMFIAGVFSLVGVLSGIGQATALTAPITEVGQTENVARDHQTRLLLLTQESLGQYLGATPGTRLEPLGKEDQKAWLESAMALVAMNLEQEEQAALGQWIWLKSLDDLRAERQESLAQRPTDNESRRATQVRLGELESELSQQSTAMQALLPGNIQWEQLKELVRESQTQSWDAVIWSVLIGSVSLILLLTGRFRTLEVLCLVLVGLFTVATIINLYLLQQTSWSIRFDQIASGLQFHLPEDTGLGSFTPVATALMTFGIIGVGAAELLAYPYWCLEKGYARFTGPSDNSVAWAERATGWLKVLRLDAWLSMLVYTFSTIAFYLLGAAVLHSLRITPDSQRMVSSLAIMFEPTMGVWGKVIFLTGAIAVLYSTFLVATASHSKTAADAFRVAGFFGNGLERKAYKWICTIVILVVLVLVSLKMNPAQIVLIGGFFQALMLPVLASTALYFRYQRRQQKEHRSLDSGWLWDAMLWLSSAGMLICGLWLFYTQLTRLL